MLMEWAWVGEDGDLDSLTASLESRTWKVGGEAVRRSHLHLHPPTHHPPTPIPCLLHPVGHLSTRQELESINGRPG